MSEPIIVNCIEDLPCLQWDGIKWRDCYMKKWHEGEERMCMDCGWKILYDEGENHTI